MTYLERIITLYVIGNLIFIIHAILRDRKYLENQSTIDDFREAKIRSAKSYDELLELLKRPELSFNYYGKRYKVIEIKDEVSGE